RATQTSIESTKESVGNAGSEDILRIAWVVYGPIEQLTGGYVYDQLVVQGLRRLGDSVEVISLKPRGLLNGMQVGVHLARWLSGREYDAVVGDELCYPEVSSAFTMIPRRLATVLLVHHLTRWEGGA